MLVKLTLDRDWETPAIGLSAISILIPFGVSVHISVPCGMCIKSPCSMLISIGLYDAIISSYQSTSTTSCILQCCSCHFNWVNDP